MSPLRGLASRLFGSVCTVIATDLEPLAASVSPARADTGLCVFDLRGNAFLYNMVRHIMAVLLLVGAGLERPAVMSAGELAHA